MKTHLIVFSSPDMSREDLVKVIDEMADAVTYWYYCLPNSVFVTSPLDAYELAEKIEERIDVKDTKFIVAEISGDKAQGRLPEAGWRIVNHPDSPKTPKRIKPRIGPPKSRQ